MRQKRTRDVATPAAYSAVELNAYSETGWAVVDTSSGAIAADEAGALCFRMTREQAQAAALKCSVGSLERHYGFVA